jgi:hypothetical protein
VVLAHVDTLAVGTAAVVRSSAIRSSLAYGLGTNGGAPNKVPIGYRPTNIHSGSGSAGFRSSVAAGGSYRWFAVSFVRICPCPIICCSSGMAASRLTAASVPPQVLRRRLLASLLRLGQWSKSRVQSRAIPDESA